MEAGVNQPTASTYQYRQRKEADDAISYLSQPILSLLARPSHQEVDRQMFFSSGHIGCPQQAYLNQKKSGDLIRE